MRRYIPLAIALALAALLYVIVREPDDKKLERLQVDAAFADLAVFNLRRTVDSAGRNSVYADSLHQAEIRRDLAQRALRKFLNGR